jgi:hypothetical protein
MYETSVCMCVASEALDNLRDLMKFSTNIMQLEDI